MENPFKFGTIVEAEYFTDRVKEVAYIRQFVESPNHLVLISPRRFGKNSVVAKAVKQTGHRHITLNLLKSKYLSSPIHYQGLQRIEPLEIPEEVLREMIFNSIIHKEYCRAHIQMKVYDNRVVLWNPGALPADLPASKLLEPHPSEPRNANVASVFYKAGFIESWGRGIQKIVDGLAAAGLPPPLIESCMNGVRITVARPKAISTLFPSSRTLDAHCAHKLV